MLSSLSRGLAGRCHCQCRLPAVRLQTPPQPNTGRLLSPSFLSSSSSAATFPSRSFSATTCHRSKIGRLPLALPPGVTLEVLPPLTPSAIVGESGLSSATADADLRSRVSISGPLGTLELPIPTYAHLEQVKVAGSELVQYAVRVSDEKNKHQRAMWGTTRACLDRNILGVSEGHACILTFVGVGYRAAVDTTSATGLVASHPGQQFISLKLGYGHPIELPVPKGITASCPQTTKLLLDSIDKELVTDFAAQIQEWRKPEPYKGKGIFINGQTIRLKAKKIK